MVYFNTSIFCDLQGHYHDLSYVYNLFFSILFLITGFGIVVLCGCVVYKGAIKSKTLRKKKNTFVLSLIVSDFLFGIIFVPLFVAELYRRVANYQGDYCSIRSWRVIFFTYLFSCRLLSVVFISLNTYIKACKSRTKLDGIFSKLVRWLTVCVVWVLPAIILLSIAFHEPDNYKVLGTVTYAYYFVSITIIIVSYAMTYYSIQRAKSRGVSNLYDEAIDFVRGILIWFLITTLLLGACGLALVVLAHNTHIQDTNALLEHHLYITAIFICTLDAIANPVVYLRKFKEFQLKRDTSIEDSNVFSKATVNSSYRSDSPKLVTKYASISLPMKKGIQ